MRPVRLLSACLAAGIPIAAVAEDIGPFGALDVVGGVASGTSSTTDGGEPFARGGVVDDVTMGPTVGLRGQIGYRFDSSWSAFVSYQHIEGDVSWIADFPAIGASSTFDGTATSDAILGNIAYDLPLSDVTVVKAVAGLGISFNTLSDVIEADAASGTFLARLADRTTIAPIVQVETGIQHTITPNAMLGLSASIAHVGGFETGNTRRGNIGVRAINPYRIDDVWRANIGVSLRVRF